MFGTWKVESLRLTVFHQVSDPPRGLWEKLMGSAPDSRDEKPKLGVSSEQGSATGNSLILQTQRGRLDWLFMPMPPPPNIHTNEVASLLSVEDSIKLFDQALLTTFSFTRNPTRLALGVVLFEECSDQRSCTKRIAEHVPGIRDAIIDTTDLIFQVNRIRRSKRVPHVTINRICNWQVANVLGGNIYVTPTQAPQFQSSAPKSLAKVTLDINTVAGQTTAISTDNYRKLLSEFVELAHEVAVEGDIV